jgi:thiol-disulfide isomerase/thioredoxin
MKIQLFIITFFILSTLSAQEKKIIYIASGKSMTEKEYDIFKINFKEKSEKEFKGGQLKETIKDSISGNAIYKLVTLSFTYSSNTVTEEFINSYIGKKFPLFEFETMESTNLSLKDLEGKPTLINLWFVGCAPCMRELPALEDLKLKYKDKVNFIAITFNNKDLVERLLKIKSFNYTHIVNAQQFLNNIGVNSYPKNIFLDKNGIVRNIKTEISYKKLIENNKEILKYDTTEYEGILNNLL